MDPRVFGRSFPIASFFLTTAALLTVGCSGGMTASNSTSTPTTPAGPTGAAFVVGADVPMASVTSFSVQVESIDAIDATGKSVPLLTGTPTVDFARYNGLQTLLDMNNVPVGTYDSVSITLGTATIGYLSTAAGVAPTIQTEPATLTSSTISVTLAKPLVVAQAAAPVGLRVDFNLAKSIQVDSSGQITGMVTPTFTVDAVAATDSGGYIDEFVAAVVSVSNTASAQSFVVQGPHGEQFTINVTGQTEWDNNESLSSLTTSSIVQISGKLDPATLTLDADEVAILSQTGFYASGQITYVQPPTGTATSFDLYVRGLLPTNTGVTLGQIAQVNLTGNEKFFIYWMHNPLSQFLFNPGALLAGQSVAVGGPASGAANGQAVTVERVALKHWGFNGTVVASSVDQAKGTFQMQIDGFAGVLVPQTVTVYAAGKSQWRDGFNGIGDLTSGANVRVVGLLLKDPSTGGTVLLAHYTDDMK